MKTVSKNPLGELREAFSLDSTRGMKILQLLGINMYELAFIGDQISSVSQCPNIDSGKLILVNGFRQLCIKKPEAFGILYKLTIEYIQNSFGDIDAKTRKQIDGIITETIASLKLGDYILDQLLLLWEGGYTGFSSVKTIIADHLMQQGLSGLKLSMRTRALFVLLDLQKKFKRQPRD